MSTAVSHRPFGWGADLKWEDRPGIPRVRRDAKAVPGAHLEIERQPVPRPRPTRRREIEGLTPVFGTAQPPRGVSGLLRRAAYRLPETRARHWLLLLAADRVDVLMRRLRRHGRSALLLIAATGLARRALGSRL